MTYSVGIIMDPIASIKPYKDTSFAMMLEAQQRNAELFYIEMQDLFIEQGIAKTLTRKVEVTDVEKDSLTPYYRFISEDSVKPLGDFDVLLMRKDPPVDAEFIYTTHILSLAQEQGALVVNNPQSLRDFNEKLFTSYFPDLIPPTLVSKDPSTIRAFHQHHGTIICKPLDGMGGTSIFKVEESGNNLGVIIETLTQHGQQFMMAQRFMPEIKEGDKRILIVDGEVMPYALARLPSKGETRGNLAVGGTGRPQPLSDSDFHVAQQIAPVVKDKGLMFVGLDVIGDKVTEINITSPTCVREIEQAFPVGILSKLFDAIEQKLAGCTQ
ncbi:glutathione synthase [Alteromonas sediminis]|uniref:Glutathione synthetase n=1 Tax=Alteromonas sediminis TaxID=2259342 RepID=A0A3N5Y2H8_9ALTE|nr:glutathione synthase [Alteromonas sediminis]RPJ67922.1 glutathione synthase [Alteromonas sediminis]